MSTSRPPTPGLFHVLRNPHLPPSASSPCTNRTIDTLDSSLAAATESLQRATMKSNLDLNRGGESRGMKESQRALELRKYVPRTRLRRRGFFRWSIFLSSWFTVLTERLRSQVLCSDSMFVDCCVRWGIQWEFEQWWGTWCLCWVVGVAIERCSCYGEVCRILLFAFEVHR